VLDEKTKDAVKITVIATGFKDEDRPRRKTESSGFTVHAESDDFTPEVPARGMVMEAPQPPPPVPAPSPAPAASEAVTLETMRNAMIANFEQADLDVPAFLRKRGEAI